MMDCGLQRIEDMVQETFLRKQSAWVAFVDTGKRFDDAYYVMIFAREDFINAKKRLRDGSGTKISVEMANKRRKSAQEEFNYQEKMRRRVRSEFESAWHEHKYWSEMLRQKRAEVDSCDNYSQKAFS